MSGAPLERTKNLRLPVLSLPDFLNYHSQQEHRPSGGWDSWDVAAGTKVVLENKHKDTVTVSGHKSLLSHETQLPVSYGQLWAVQACKLVSCL